MIIVLMKHFFIYLSTSRVSFSYLFITIRCICFSLLATRKTPLYFLIFSTLLNVGLDLLFVMPIKLNSLGLALGTIISEAIAAILSLVVLFKSIDKMDKERVKGFDKNIFKEIVSVSIPSILQGLFISIGGVLITTILTNVGGNNVAGGYSAAYKICYIAINIFTVLCNALTNFVSQNIGAKKYERIMQGYFSTLIISAIFCLIATVIILPFREFWVNLFLNSENSDETTEIVNSGTLFISSIVPFFFLMVIKIPLDGVLKGSMDMLGFTLGTSIDLVVRVLASSILGHYFGYQGVYFAWPLGWGVGAIISVVFFFSGRWKRKCHFPCKENLQIVE